MIAFGMILLALSVAFSGFVADFLWTTREQSQPTVASSLTLFVQRWHEIGDEPVRRYLDSIGWPDDATLLARHNERNASYA